MAGNSKIEWADATWNPIVGCTIVSPGCTHCYAMAMAARLEAMGQQAYRHKTKKVNGNAVWTGEISLVEDRLAEPILRRKPTMYFVNSMGDLFHESVSDEWIDRVFAVMAQCPQHTFQVLTKRAERMRAYVEGVRCASGNEINQRPLKEGWRGWPLPNVWLGVSAERQQEADERIPNLLQTTAAVRFVSAEPLLGPIDLTRVDEGTVENGVLGERTWVDALRGTWAHTHSPTGYVGGTFARLDWVIAGGESGPRARPIHPEWARSLRDQCAAAGVAFFFKQWGQWDADALLYTDLDGRCPPPKMMVGKKRAGRLLDGCEQNGMPGEGAAR